MLRSFKSLKGYTLGATDGEIGKVRDLYFDDQGWQVRYLVADTGGWLTGREVLLSPAVLGVADADYRVLQVSLTREMVRSSPSVLEHQPVSRRMERELATHYGWPMYWEMSMAGAGAVMMPPPTGPDVQEDREWVEARSDDDAHLRSAMEVIGYRVHASDGDMGHVHDLIVDQQEWVIQYVVVDTATFWPGRKVTMLPMWISGISYPDGEVRFDLPQETIRSGPEYDPAAPINADQVTQLSDYYGRPARKAVG